MQSLHLCLSFSQRLSHRVGRSVGLGGVLLAAVVLSAGCDEKSPQTRQSTASLRSSGKSGGTVQQAPGGGYVESSENAQDRPEAVRGVCRARPRATYRAAGVPRSMDQEPQARSADWPDAERVACGQGRKGRGDLAGRRAADHRAVRRGCSTRLELSRWYGDGDGALRLLPALSQ